MLTKSDIGPSDEMVPSTCASSAGEFKALTLTADNIPSSRKIPALLI